MGRYIRRLTDSFLFYKEFAQTTLDENVLARELLPLRQIKGKEEKCAEVDACLMIYILPNKNEIPGNRFFSGCCLESGKGLPVYVFLAASVSIAAGAELILRILSI